MMVVAPEVKSPCIDVCKIDPASGLCAGCLRTLDEIVGWAAADRETKLAVLARVEQRRAGPAAPDGAGRREDER